MAAEQAAKDLRTVFIRGISFDADEKDLEAAFSDVGPVKQCFLVRVKGQPKHRGFGFVQYALPEDAERAVTELDGKSVKGRKLQVEVANKRAPLEDRKRKRREGQPADGAAAATADGAEGADAADADADGAKPAPAAAASTAATTADGKKAAPASAAAAPAATAAAPASAAVAAAPPAKRQRQPAAAAAGGAAAAEKHKLLRAVAVGCLTPAAVTQAVALARKAGPVEEVLNPAPQEVVHQAKLAADGCSGSVIIVVYKTVKDAMAAVAQLHGRELTLGAAGGKGKKQGKKGKGKRKGADSDDEEEAADEGQEGEEAQKITLWAREVKGEGAHVKQWRVIMRNLPFKVTEVSLRKALEPVGFVWELKLPRGPDGRVKGFAFAAFTCRAHAEKAIASLNGKDFMGRMVVVDWAVPKQQYEAASRQAAAAAKEAGEGAAGGEEEEGAKAKAKAKAAADKDSDSDAPTPSGSEDGEDDDDDDGEDEDDDDEEIGLGSDDDDEDGDDDLMNSDDDEEDGENDEDEDDDEEEGDEEEEEEGEDAEVRAERGLLSSALDSVLAAHEAEPGAGGEAGKGKGPKGQEAAQGDRGELGARARAPGAEGPKPAWRGEEAEDPDAAAERSRPAGTSGADALAQTVFVRGLPLDVTAPALQARLELFGPVKACRLVLDKASRKPKGTAFVEFRSPESAAKAAAACERGRRHEGPGITLAGRPLDVALALSADGARQVAADRAASKTAGRDKRNLYLAKEGAVVEGSAAWRGMSESDQAKRKRGAEEKNIKLKSPNFIVSRTRLSVRNIPHGTTEAQLRALFIKAVRDRATKEQPRVLSAKILKEKDKYDASGARKSKGMGFVEFESHEHALTALRQLNNNPGTPWGRDRRPIVEFAIDNVKVLKKLEHLRERAFEVKAQREQAKAGAKGRGGKAEAAEEADEAEAADGDAEAEADGGDAAEEGGEAKGAGKGAGKKGRKGKKGEGEAEANGDGDGAKGGKDRKEAKVSKRRAEAPADADGEGGALSKRQRKRQRQKERVERKKELLKEGGVQALVAEVEANKQRRASGGPGAGADKAGGRGAKGGAREPGQGPRGRPQAPARAGRQPERAQGRAAQGRGQEQGGDGGKRRAEEREIDRIAQSALEEGAGARHAKRRRRNEAGEEGEGKGDRLDRLVENYRQKLAGKGAPAGGKAGAGAGKAAAGGPKAKGGAKAGVGGGKPAGGGAKAGGAKAGGGKAAGDAAAGVAALIKGASSGGLRRWFD
ncbi:hypothetical protein HYH03_018977 [Edaphochlamys debaryana]|uniref:RRM domain-containing protein n=1 Tax=Edaphochlamys debaryana TaxID=47281 RepID=A0A836BMT3_9CHLO|nr:hypothetical protein HYH03_018977 [Edaphochlamys debaryana]|eukprot:KAG2482067.1 hypothetical protein HYH03_018977 [Edaphochlamys debaryana]